MKTHQKGFILPLVIVVIALLAIGGGAYVYTKNKEAAQTSILTSATTTTEVSTNQPATNNQSNLSRSETINSRSINNKTYINSKYGFTLTFPTSWSDYSVKEDSKNDVNGGAIWFGLKNQDKIFDIIVLNQKDYADYKKLNNDAPCQLLGQKNSYTYLSCHAEAAYPYLSDLSLILSTFKLTN